MTSARSRPALAALRLSFRVAPVPTSVCVALGLLTGAAAAPAGWIASRLVDDLTAAQRTGASSEHIVLLIVAQGVITLAGVLGAYGAGAAAVQAKGRLRIHCEVELAEQVARHPGVEHLHDPAALDQLHLARRAAHEAPGVVIELLVQVLSSTMTVVTFAVVVALSWPWMLVALAGTAVPAAILQRRMMHRAVVVAEESSAGYRWADYYAELQHEPAAARTLRLHAALAPAIGRLRAHLSDAVHQENVQIVRSASVQALFTAISAVVVCVGTLIVGIGVLDGRATVGQFVLFGIAVVAVQRAVFSLISSVGYAAPSLAAFGGYLRFVDAPDEAAADGGDPAEPLRDAIVLTDVWFTYPGSDTPVIRGLTMRIEAGTTHAIVGQNGAGKSTLLALVMRLYQPDRGTITWDGRPIEELSVTSLRNRISVVLQDAPRLEMTAHDVIALDALDSPGARPAVVAAARSVGADQFVERLAKGYDTVLGTGRVDGTTVSGGQWQRLALARAALRDADVCVFDEPTNGLDAYAQARYVESALAIGSGRTTVVVSHHFLQLRHADRITVIDEGAVAETGSHADLVALGGTYAEMYDLQVRGASRPDAPAGTT
ncbi:ATP-binding cassette domain-containing protein [Pimelobacter simplex]|uniref:ATP-binding cassette domain-containing protein n=1 Tax=Nocardioides simplex TaxID=2045 RepID=UPI003AB0BBE3